MFVDDRLTSDSLKPADWSGSDLERSPTLEHPVQKVSWIDVCFGIG